MVMTRAIKSLTVPAAAFTLVFAVQGCGASANHVAARQAIIGVANTAREAQGEIGVHAAELVVAADGIEREGVAATLPYAASVRLIAGRLVELGEVIRERVVVPLVAAASNAARLEAELAETRAAIVREKRRADAAESSRILLAAVGLAVAGALAVGVGLVVFKSVGIAAIGGSLLAASALLVALAKLVASAWFLPGVGAVLVALAIGAVIAWRKGWLTFRSLDSAAKLLKEGSIAEGIAALRTDADFEASWRKAGGK